MSIHLTQDNQQIEDLLSRHLDVLDAKQRDVDAIRWMHHDVWKDSQEYPIIKQHRSGSRVEKQLRLLQAGKQTDIDYTFEVTDIQVARENENNLTMYWKCSTDSIAYGKVYANEECKNMLLKQVHHKLIFTEDAFKFDCEESAFLLQPVRFKENVVKVSNFQYAKAQETKKSVKSPSIPGYGSINEYDVVPCLRLKDWPEQTNQWCLRGKENEIFNAERRELIRKSVSLFLVPTGNPRSEESSNEFRLSFSFIEIKLFEDIPAKVRKCYGIGKYLFKAILGDEDIMDSYHIKTLFLWMTETKSLPDWEKFKFTEFLSEFFGKIDDAIHRQYIPHFFVEDCNIFPVHKFSQQKLKRYMVKKENLCEEIWKHILQLLRHDLALRGDFDEDQMIMFGMKSLDEKMKNEPYVNGYLVRLLSVTTFSLYENKAKGKLSKTIQRIDIIFKKYSSDPHISRIIPMVNATLESLQSDEKQPFLIPSPTPILSEDVVSEKAHQVFEAYTNERFDQAEKIIANTEFNEFRPNAFGVSVTACHKGKVDQQIGFIIAELEKESKNGKAPRFYLDPYLLLHHIQIQLNFLKGNAGQLENHLKVMENIVEMLSEKEPYLGKLSYKFSGVYLLRGYEKFPLSSNQGNISLLQRTQLGYFNQRMFAGNFDLR